jgi:hypothetical protein
MDQLLASGAVDDLGEGGGLADDFDFTVTGLRTLTHTLGATTGPYMEITFAADGYDDPVVQFYSVGKSQDWLPNGTGFVGVKGPNSDGTPQKISKNSNVGMFIISLGNCGYPTSIIKDGNFMKLVGLKGHAKRQKVERNNLTRGKDKSGNDRDFQVLVVTRVTEYRDATGNIVSMSTTPAPTQATATSAPAVDPNQAAAAEVVVALLKSNPNGIAQGDLLLHVYNHMKTQAWDDGKKSTVMALCSSPAFISLSQGWKVDNGIIRLS